MSVQTAALVATVVSAAMIGFQLLLAAGLPLGRAAWGGQYAVLPPKLRLGSLAAAAIIGLAMWVVLARSGLVNPGAGSVAVRVAAWVFGGYFCLNTLGNLASKSKLERAVMTPVALVMAICFLLVAWS